MAYYNPHITKVGFHHLYIHIQQITRGPFKWPSATRPGIANTASTIRPRGWGLRERGVKALLWGADGIQKSGLHLNQLRGRLVVYPVIYKVLLLAKWFRIGSHPDFSSRKRRQHIKTQKNAWDFEKEKNLFQKTCFIFYYSISLWFYLSCHQQQIFMAAQPVTLHQNSSWPSPFSSPGLGNVLGKSRIPLPPPSWQLSKKELEESNELYPP